MRLMGVFLAAFLVSSCASVPPTEQYLDDKTGATITRIDAPYYLYRRVARVREAQVQFMQMAPIYVNRAGKRQLYLWLEIPSEQAPVVAQFRIDGSELSLPMVTSNRRSIGIGEHVYAGAAGYGAEAYYELSSEQLALIARAKQLQFTANDGAAVFASSGENAKASVASEVLLRSL